MPYGFFITDKGRELMDRAIVNGEKVSIVNACFGSGGDPETERDYGITELRNQFYEKRLSPDTDAYKLDDNDPYSLLIRSVVPDDVTGTFNEVGFKDDNGNLIIYGVVQEKVKEPTVQGTQSRFQYDNWIKLENGDADKVEIVIKSPEYEKVEELVERAEREFDLSNYVKKVDGKDLISTTDIDQIATNKNNITEIQSQLQGVETTLSSLNTRMGKVV